MITKSYMTSRIQKTYLALVAVSVLVGVGLVMSPLQKVQAAPATFVVTNTNDSGAGSLRQAIVDANTNGNPSEQDIIEFNIGTSGDLSIEPLTQLEITQSVIIDGFTQSDAAANTSIAPYPLDSLIRIEIINDTSGHISVTGDNVTIRGLAINGSTDGELRVTEAAGFKLYGSHIGSMHEGLLSRFGVSSTEPLIDLRGATNTQIGGSDAAMRNVLGYSTQAYISAEESSGIETTNLIIQGNNIGVGADSVSQNLGNIYSNTATGILLTAGTENVAIGGETNGEGNIIQNLGGGAIQALDMSQLYIYGNIIQNNGDVESQGGMIEIEGSTQVTIGSSTGNGKNNISGTENGIHGLVIKDSTDTSQNSSDITIQNNMFGFNYEEDVDLPIAGGGIIILDASEDISVLDNTIKGNLVHSAINIGGTAHTLLIRGNTISNLAQYQAILIEDFAYDTHITQNTITGIINNTNTPAIQGYGSIDTIAITENSIYGNSYEGIRVDSPLNHPEDISYEETESNTTEMRFNLSLDAGEYRVDFFSNNTTEDPYYGSGQTFLGYQNITHTGSGVEEFTATLPGVDLNNITATTTEIDNTTTSGFGRTGEFSEYATEYIPPPPGIDLASQITLMNPEDVTLGALLNYEITVTNHGPGSIDIGDYDGSGQNALTNMIIPEDTTFVSNAGGNISCSSLGPGSAPFAGPALADHSSYELVICGYSGGSHILAPGESISTTMTVEVQNTSDLEFALYVVAPTPLLDPDYSYITSVYLSGNDMITTYETEYPPNNFSRAVYPIIDININKTLVEPTDVSVGSTVTYNFVISNDGTQPINIAEYDGSGVNPLVTALFLDLMPPELTYVSISEQNMACTGGPASLADPIFSDHGDYTIILCTYTESLVLQPGDSISFSMSAEIIEPIISNITNFALRVSAYEPNDPDSIGMLRALTSSFSGLPQYDILNVLSLVNNGPNNSFSSAEYSIPEDPGPDPDPDPETPTNTNGGNSESDSSNSLADTGLGQAFILILAGTLIGVAVISSSIYLKRTTKNT